MVELSLMLVLAHLIGLHSANAWVKDKKNIKSNQNTLPSFVSAFCILLLITKFNILLVCAYCDCS
jgi:hypothetical protein